MDYTIRFIGVVMLVTGMTGMPFNNHAYLPLWSSATYCGVNTPPKHVANLRIITTQILDKTGWPPDDQKPCDKGQNCTLFAITTPSTLTIDSGFTPVGSGILEDSSFCLVPQLRHEMSHHNAKLVANPQDHSIVDLALPSGTLKSKQFSTNHMIVSTLTVQAPPGSSKTGKITIVAKPHATGGTLRTLIVSAGSEITIENTESGEAGVNPSMPAMGPIVPASAHFFLYNELLEPATRICGETPPAKRPCAKLTAGPGTGLEFLCSNSGCCHP